MNRFFYEIMNKLNIGIILLDQDRKIIFWNLWMENKTDLKLASVFNYPIEQVSPKFLRPKYNKVIEMVQASGQARFLAGAVHGSFFTNLEEQATLDQNRKTLQNLQIERTENNFIIIQVEDHTGHYQKVKPLQTFIKSLEKENDEIRLTEEQARQMTMHDVLTGLPNRLFLMNKLRKRLEVNKFEKNDHILAVFFIDMDNLKAFNDLYGHRIGDAILRAMSKRLIDAVRGTDTVTRLSGDEFVIFMEGMLDRSDIEKVATNIMNQFNAPLEIDALSLAVSCSMGISLYPKNSSDADELLDQAYQALSGIKNTGKANFAFFSE